ncbi:hypothetical protein ACFMPD_13495 [Sedimentitalea sp. HM32M-2]
MQFYLGVPIHDPNNAILRALAAIGNVTGAWHPDDVGARIEFA